MYSMSYDCIGSFSHSAWKTGQNNITSLCVVGHMAMQMAFPNSGQKSGQNGIYHHYVPYMVSHDYTGGSFSDSGQKSSQNGI